MRMIWIPPLLLLAACGGEPAKDKHPLPPDVAANFSGPLDARGADPAWGLTVRGALLVLTRANQPALAVTASAPSVQAHQATWTAPTPDRQTVTVTFYASACADTAASVTYPFAVEVDLPGQSPLTGCGGPPARR